MNAHIVNRFQHIGRFHPFTCGNCRDNKKGPDGFPAKEFELVAHDEAGTVVLTCREADCAWRQVLSADMLDLVDALMEPV
jgi:hypothetical protein